MARQGVTITVLNTPTHFTATTPDKGPIKSPRRPSRPTPTHPIKMLAQLLQPMLLLLLVQQLLDQQGGQEAGEGHELRWRCARTADGGQHTLQQRTMGQPRPKLLLTMMTPCLQRGTSGLPISPSWPQEVAVAPGSRWPP